ncbi:MAG: hypothetical protein DHS20C18_01680 [Saprospiraceae bacterium]|nr:MAG: hypothetical protein DHS20C18_01680 [Saprospiraceae bacterium]
MSEIVHDFVKSMTMREKAYFRRSATLHGERPKKNYLLLYDFLEKAPSYNKKAIQKHFSGTPIGKYLSSEMNYLLEQLLNSAINFHFNNSAHRKLIKLILYIDLLSEKGFRRKAQKIMVQAKKLAYRFEDFAAILKLIQMEEDILFSHGILNFTQQLEQLRLEREAISQKIQNANALRLLREQIRELQFTEGFITDTEKYPIIYDNPLLESKEQALSLTAKANWYYIQGLKHYLIRQFKSSQLANRDHLNFFETHPKLFKPAQMLPALSNYIFLSALVRDEKSFREGLQKLKTLEGNPDLDQNYIKYIYYARQFEWHYQHTNIRETQRLLTEVGDFFLSAYQKLGNAEVDYLVRLLSRASLLCQDWSKGLDWVRFWYQIKKSNHGMQVIHHFSLIIYYELGYWELLESQIHASYKGLKKHSKFNTLEKCLLSFFKKIPVYKNAPDTELKYLRFLEEKLLIIRDDTRENEIFEFFCFHEWCRGRQWRVALKMQL